MITFKKKLLLNSIGPERVKIVVPYLLVISSCIYNSEVNDLFVCPCFWFAAKFFPFPGGIVGLRGATLTRVKLYPLYWPQNN